MVTSPVFLHMITLMLTVFFSFLLARVLGPQYDLELTALLFAIYIIVKRFSKAKLYESGLTNHQILESVLFTMIIMNVIVTTGGLQSPFFFLMYFLLFALALMLEPVVSLTTTLTIVALFVPDIPVNFSYTQLLPLISLPFLVPFAVYLGSSLRAREKQRRKLRALEVQQSYTEKDALMFVSTVVRTHVQTIQTSAENIPAPHGEEVKKIRSSAKRLEKLIDTFEKMY